MPEYVQKHIRGRDINIRLLDIALLMELAQLRKAQAKCLIRYLTQEANLLGWDAFLRILNENTPRYREDIMTVPEQLKRVGREIGLQEGLERGRDEGRNEQARGIARNMLALGLDRATIERVTGLNKRDLAALAN